MKTVANSSSGRESALNSSPLVAQASRLHCVSNCKPARLKIPARLRDCASFVQAGSLRYEGALPTLIALLSIFLISCSTPKYTDFFRTIEASAKLHVLHADSQTIICSQTVQTGKKSSHELIMLDTRTQKVRWRIPIAHSLNTAHLIERDGILLFGDGLMERRRLVDGHLEWKTMLGRETPKVTNRPPEGPIAPEESEEIAPTGDANQNWTGPNLHPVSPAMITDDQVFVSRSGIYQSGCVTSYNFHDWFSITLESGKILCRGAGVVAGSTGNRMYVVDPFGLYFVTPHSSGSLPRVKFRDGHVGARSRPFSNVASSCEQAAGYCVWEGVGFVDRLDRELFVVMNEEDSRTKVLAFPRENDSRYFVVPTKAGLVIFRIPNDQFAQKTRELILMDLEGKTLSQTPIDTSEGRLSFTGRTSNDEPVFQTGQKLLRFKLPTLETQSITLLERVSKLPKSSEKQGLTVLHDQPAVLVSEGSISFGKMPKRPVQHTLALSLVSLDTGKTEWEIGFPVTIGKESE